MLKLMVDERELAIIVKSDLQSLSRIIFYVKGTVSRDGG
jgi:hypothetical protein